MTSPLVAGDLPVHPHGRKATWFELFFDLVFVVAVAQLGMLSRRGNAKTAESALEQALIARYGCLGRVPKPFLLRSDNGLIFTSRRYTALVKSYGLRQEFITPHSPEQHGLVERVIRTLKDQCIHRQRFESLPHASRAIADWIQFYNHRRPHQALGMKTPAEAFALAA